MIFLLWEGFRMNNLEEMKKRYDEFYKELISLITIATSAHSSFSIIKESIEVLIYEKMKKITKSVLALFAISFSADDVEEELDYLKNQGENLEINKIVSWLENRRTIENKAERYISIYRKSLNDQAADEAQEAK